MKLRTLLLLPSLLLCIIVHADPVGIEQARVKAAKFLHKNLNGTRISNDTPAYAPARTIRGAKIAEQTPAYYVFNTEDNNGYVIISGEDKTNEVLGYSTSGNFDIDNMPSNVKAWMEGYAEQISILGEYSSYTNSQTYNSQWKAIEPMLTTKWNQSAPYNNNCPKQNGKACVTGCSATAMAQVMKYHEWPKTKTPKFSAYRTESANIMVSKLDSTIFRWDEMKNSYEPNEDGDAVAELMRYCGQAIVSDYTQLGTGAYTSDVVKALVKSFDYDCNISLKNILFYNISEWENMIYNELKESRPIYHAGYSLEGGHAFVCDGYDGNGLYHFNWGWGGMYDGYYKLSLLDPESGGIGSGSYDGYSYNQEIVIGIQPNTGAEEKPILFEPYSEQIDGNFIYSFFYNTSYKSASATTGFATIDENGEIIKVLNQSGRKTLQGGYNGYFYIQLDLANNPNLTPGKHRIVTVCKAANSTKWYRVGSSGKYFEVEISNDKKNITVVLHPIKKLEFTSFAVTSERIENMKQNVAIGVKNNADEVYTSLNLFASKNENKGNVQGRAVVMLKPNEEIVLNLGFTPESSGTYNIWISEKTDGSDPVLTKTVDIKSAPTSPYNLSLVKCEPNADDISVDVQIRNNSTDTYYKGIILMLLENLYDNGYLYGTEMVELPGNIEAGTSKNFFHDFLGENSNKQSAIYVGYYKKHSDKEYTQLGDYTFFEPNTSDIDNTIGSSIHTIGIYRLDGTRVDATQIKGIIIKDGKIIVKQ